MPGMYQDSDYDLAGFIVGVVEKKKILKGDSIAPDDIILGLPSSGLHTNGYSLVRKVFDIDQNPSVLQTCYPELGQTLGEVLLQPHRCYFNEIRPVLAKIKGLAHITGGGFIGNIPRILPQGLAAHINKGTWQVPPIFSLMQQKGDIEDSEMYQVFNMGHRMEIYVDPQLADSLMAIAASFNIDARIVGRVEAWSGRKLTIHTEAGIFEY
ncbi:MAG TPA: hypothetical protein DCY35_09170 [Prolixibacteraceae bacterium]|nr:hypothetical protein [Prolixibacteraceae bacterium]